MNNYSEPEYPIAAQHPYPMTIHGHTRIDPYYWLKERDGDDVLAYLEAENAYTKEILKDTEAVQETLYNEIKSRIKEDDNSIPYFKNHYWYYTRYETGKEYPIYCRKKDSMDALEEIMLNVNEVAEGHAYCQIGCGEVSEDNKIFAYSVDFQSRHIYTIYFKHLETGELLPGKIAQTAGDFVWANDHETLFYTVRNKALRPYKVFRHHLHDLDNSRDVEVFHEKDAQFSLDIDRSKSEKYLFISSESTLSDETRFLPADDPFGTWTVFQKRQKGLEYSIEHFKDCFFVLTNLRAKNFRLMKTPVTQTGSAHWEDVIAPREKVKIEDVDIFENHLVLIERENGLNHLRIIHYPSLDSYYIPMPEEVYQTGIAYNPEINTNLLRYGYTSMTTPSTTFEFNMDTKEQKLLKQQIVLDPLFSPEHYETKRFWVTADDGTQVPLSIVHKKGISPNGKNPLLLYGYGSYGISMDPYFSVSRLSLLDRGFIFAMAHIRGGEELGREWYEDGKLLKKKNTFTDFINCAEWLIREQYTSPEYLCGMGGSAGGLLIGAVANMRPDLFKALIAEVPFVDVVTTMLDEDIPLTVGEYDEWGNPNEKIYYDYMLSYSPYDNVKAQDYPHILVETGYHDSQVQYWEPAKWVAKLRALKTDKHLLVFKIEMDFGHSGASGRFESLKETAFEYTFLLKTLNLI